MTHHVSTGTRAADRWWMDPFAWGFVVLAVAACVVCSIASAEWVSSLVLYAVIALGSLLVRDFTRRTVPPPVLTAHPAREGWVALAWYAVFVGVSLATGGGAVFGNEFMKYLWFVVAPVGLVFAFGNLGVPFRQVPVRDVLRSIGFRREGLGKALLLALLAYAVAFAGILFFLPDAQMDKLTALAREPLKLLLAVPLAFVLALVTAAVTEEIFFRGIIQSRLAVMLKSEVRACVVAALLFGLYHLPYAYFSDSWPTHGNVMWAVSGVIAEQAVTGIILGVLWSRTRNLAAPVLFHALVNTLGVITMINFG